MDLDLYEECCHCWERTRTDSIVSNPTVIGGPEGGNVGTQTIDASCVERWLHCLWVSGLRVVRCVRVHGTMSGMSCSKV